MRQQFKQLQRSGVTQGSNFTFNKGPDVSYDMGTEPDGFNQVGYYFPVPANPDHAITVVDWSGTTISKCETYFDQNYIFSANPASNQIDILSTILHEFGHWLYLDDETAASCSTNVMYKYLGQGDTSRRKLTSDDKNGIIEIYGSSTTGIEDDIVITRTTTNYNVNQEYVGDISATFVDNWPYGNYITHWSNWQINASSTCGNVLVYQNQSSSIDIPSLPNGYLWNRDNNGNVLATLSISATENDGTILNASAPITISGVPNTFIMSGTLASNTTWCGNFTIT